jgi:hypothetical protein
MANIPGDSRKAEGVQYVNLEIHGEYLADKGVR